MDHPEKQTNTQAEREKQAGAQTSKHKSERPGRVTSKQTRKQAGRQAGKKPSKLERTQANKQAGKQPTNGQADKHTNCPTFTKTLTHTHTFEHGP